jgi:hypothetical protein
LVEKLGLLEKYTDQDTDNTWITRIIKILTVTFCFKNTGHNAQAQATGQDPYLRAYELYRVIVKTRTFPAIQAAINYAARIDYDANPQLVRAQIASKTRAFNWLLVPRVLVVYLLKLSLNSQDLYEGTVEEEGI